MSSTLTRIQVDGLRGIANANVDGLAPVTLFLGANGCGKTTLLEAIGLACARSDAAAGFRALAKREWLGLEGLAYWFTGPSGCATIRGWVDHGGAQPTTELSTRMTLGLPRSEHIAMARGNGATGPLKCVKLGQGSALIDADGAIVVNDPWISELQPFTLERAFVDRPAGAKTRFGRERFSSALRDSLAQVKLSPYYDELIEYLQIIRPRLASIESIAVGDRDEPHVFEREPRAGYPLAYAGDGFRRSLLLAAAFARTQGGVVAIDEPEAFAHPRLYASIAKMTRRAVAEGTQIFFATHSLELVEALLREHEDEPTRVAVVCLSSDPTQLTSVAIAGANAYRRVVELGDDLRL